MKLRCVLFDLDGTLLPMDQEEFTKAYFHQLAKKLAPRGYEPTALIDAVWSGTAAMVKNDGQCSNEEAFWRRFEQIYGPKVREEKPVFEDFYANEFQLAQSVCGFTPRAAETVAAIRSMGYQVALATNPIFPSVATESRIRWAGLEPENFTLVTTYENSTHCKPNPAYFSDVAESLGLAPESCLMVGNDAREDTAAEQVGMKVFLLTDCLINKDGKDISAYPQGSFEQLMDYVKKESAE